MSAKTKPPLTETQKQLILLAGVLDKQARSQVHLALPGLCGLVLLGAAAYLIGSRS